MKPQQKTNIHVKIDQTKLPNKMHFDVQRTTRANIFRDKTKYNRKVEHKNIDNEF